MSDDNKQENAPGWKGAPPADPDPELLDTWLAELVARQNALRAAKQPLPKKPKQK